MIRFAEPWVLFFLLSIPLLALFHWLVARARARALSAFAEEKFIKTLTATFSPERRYAKAILHALCLVFLILTIARPQFGTKFADVSSMGVNIVLAVDTSASMLAEDFKPNRIIKARHQIASFVDRASGDAIGLVFFAGDAFVHCPLTLDYGTVKLFLEDMDAGIVQVPGTDLGTALDRAISAFPEVDAAGSSTNVIVLLTDGEDHEGNVMEAASRARARNIKVYTIGIGSPEGALIPVRDSRGKVEFKKDRTGKFVQTRLDVDILKKVALETGGRFYPATPEEMELDRILQEIGELEKKHISSRRYSLYEDRFQFALFLALFFLIIETFTGERRKIRVGQAITGESSVLTLIFGLLIFSALLPPQAAMAQGKAEMVREGIAMYDKGDMEGAAGNFTKAADLDPMDLRIMYNLGTVQYSQKDYEKAVRQFTEAATSEDLQLRKSSFYNLGNTLFRMEKHKEAIEAYKEALRLDPHDMDAKHNIEVIRRILKDNASKSQGTDGESGQQDENQQKQDQDQNKGKSGSGNGDNKENKQGQNQQGQQDQQKQDQQDKDKKDKNQGSGEKNEDSKDEDKKESAASSGSGDRDDQKDSEKSKAAQAKEADEQEQKAQQEKQEAGKLTREEAERLLNSLMNSEKKLRQQMHSETSGRGGRNVDKDW